MGMPSKGLSHVSRNDAHGSRSVSRAAQRSARLEKRMDFTAVNLPKNGHI